MNIYYTANHQRHQPQQEIFNGQPIPHSEVARRADIIIEALRQAQYDITSVNQLTDFDALRGILHQIHNSDYVNWLQQSHPEDAIYPSVFNTTSQALWHGSLSIQWGNYCTDLFTPLLPGTWEVAATTAQAALLAAQDLVGNPTQSGVVIGRPPGHHAGRSRVGGYCYLNNAAVAAQFLSAHGRVAILDVDYHHGNGTQDIFYDRSDVITCSLHADPQRKFPYFAGMEDEIGVGSGLNSNRNFALPAGITNEQYQPVLETALSWIQEKIRTIW